eukprot:2451554-Pyramimonas_sp.AAC.1
MWLNKRNNAWINAWLNSSPFTIAVLAQSWLFRAGAQLGDECLAPPAMSVPVKDELRIRSASSDDVLLGLGPITLSPKDDPERESGWFASPEHDMALEGCSAHGNTADEEVAAENVKEEIEDAEAAEQPA